MNAIAVWISSGALVLPCAAFADDAGAYIGAGIGYVDMPGNLGLGVPDVPVMFGETKGGEVAPGVELGYRFNRNIAVELGYVDLGDLKANVVDPNGSDASAQLQFSADGYSLALVGMFPINQWEPYVKAGAVFSSTTLNYSGSFSGAGFSAKIDNDTEDAIYGAGVRYSLTEQLKLYFDTTYFMELGEPGFGQVDYFKLSLGLNWRF